MTTITEDLRLPGDTLPPAGTSVDFVLVGTGGAPLGEAYSDSDTIVYKRTVRPGTDGSYTVELEGNDDITPTGTRWLRTVRFPGNETTTAYLLVPSSGTHRVDEVLSAEPGTILDPDEAASLQTQLDDLERLAETNYVGYAVFDDLGLPLFPDLWVKVTEVYEVTWTGVSWDIGAVLDRIGPDGPGYVMVGTARTEADIAALIPARRSAYHTWASNGTTHASTGHAAITGTGTATAQAAAAGLPRRTRRVTAASAGSTAGFQGEAIVHIGTAGQFGAGFDLEWDLYLPDASYDQTGASTGSRIGVGVSSAGSIATVLATDNFANSWVGFMRRSVNGGAGDTNWRLAARDGAATTTVDLGVPFAAATWWRCRLAMAPGSGVVQWRLHNRTTGDEYSGSWTAANLPAAATFMQAFYGLITIDAVVRAVDSNRGVLLA